MKNEKQSHIESVEDRKQSYVDKMRDLRNSAYRLEIKIASISKYASLKLDGIVPEEEVESLCALRIQSKKLLESVFNIAMNAEKKYSI